MTQETRTPGVASPGDFRMIRLDQIAWGRQPRQAFDEGALKELAESMRQRGLLCPIRVRSLGIGGYIGVFGERRCRAAKLLGWPSIPAVVIEDEPTAAACTLEQLSENLFRDELKPIERANAYRELMKNLDWSGTELALQLGISPAKVSQELKLLELPPDVQESVNGGSIPASTAYEIAKAPAEARPELVRQVTQENATRGQIRAQARKGGGRPSPRESVFKHELPGQPFAFDVTGNKVVAKGKKIDSLRTLAEAAKCLHAAAKALMKNADAKNAEQAIRRAHDADRS